MKKVVNTFLSPKIHGSFNKKNAFVANHDNTKPSKLVSFYHKLTHRLWFIPSMYSAKFWVDIKKDGKRGYTTFMKIDEKALFLIENLRKLINDKNFPEEIDIRGEVFIQNSDFAKLKNKFANPRNAASGSLRQKNPEDTKKIPLRFIAYTFGFQKGLKSVKYRVYFIHKFRKFKWHKKNL